MVGVGIDDEVWCSRSSTGLKGTLLEWCSEDGGEMEGQEDRHEG